MISFCIEICKIVIEINCNRELSKKYCAKYLCDIKPEISITVSNNRKHKSEILEIQYLVTEALASRGVLLMHGSAISVDGNAYIFIAPSGTGKSTHTALWRQSFGERALMINDDKPFIKVNSNGECLVYGSPWDGKHRLSSNIGAPLKAICCLNRGVNNQIDKITVKEALPTILTQIYNSEDYISESHILSTLDIVTSNTKIYELSCNMEIDAAKIAYEGMNA